MLLLSKRFSNLSDFHNITKAMISKGWSENRIRKFMGGNWYDFLKNVWI